MATKNPWAILLCRFKDNPDDPNKTIVKDLANANPAWFDSGASTDSRTVVDLYRDFFTDQGADTYNLSRYFSEMSHGNVEIGASGIFPTVVDMTQAESDQYEHDHTGSEYQVEVTRRAKKAFSEQHNTDLNQFYGVVISFQTPVPGAQGAASFDGTPWVMMDIRWVRNNGTQSWAHELGHGFALNHSRTDGELDGPEGKGNPDYTDMWDIMSARNTIVAADAHFGWRGPGLNAWNMRNLGWLDESRVWKRPADKDFSETATLRPLHRRDLLGSLAIELPALAGSSPFLVEFRVPQDWDAGFGSGLVVVHRFDDGHSYIMKGTNGQKVLGVGDVFRLGVAPFVKVRVGAIDLAKSYATVHVCYSLNAEVEPAVSIVFPKPAFACRHTPPVEGVPAEFKYTLQNATCAPEHTVVWNVTGAMPMAGQSNNGKTFTIVPPSPGAKVTMSVQVMFDDGRIISSTYDFNSISQWEASLIQLMCGLAHEAAPVPWWEWDPARIRQVATQFSRSELATIGTRMETLTQTVRRLGRG